MNKEQKRNGQGTDQEKTIMDTESNKIPKGH